jgi:glycosyltransferase involved in cell wall biosynthesis
VESVLALQATMLTGAGHDVRILAGRGDCELLAEMDSRHPEVEDVTRRLAAGEDGSPDFERLRLRLAAGLSTALADRDVLIAHNVLTMPFNLPLASALAGSGCRLLAWTHDLAWTNPRYAAFQRHAGPLELLAKPQPRTLYVAISHQRRDEICQVLDLPRARVPVVPNGMDVNRFLGISEMTLQLARRAGFADADPLILAPVRVTRRKRLELALEAIAELRADHPGIRLVVSGPLGPHSADNVAYAGELDFMARRLGLGQAVVFLHAHPEQDGSHPVDDATMAELYRLADVALLTSEAEGFGLPLLEAGLLRLPLVHADLPVLAELGRGATWTFPSGSGGAAAAALRHALASRPVRQRRRVVREASGTAVLAQTERVLDMALAAP